MGKSRQRYRSEAGVPCPCFSGHVHARKACKGMWVDTATLRLVAAALRCSGGRCSTGRSDTRHAGGDEVISVAVVSCPAGEQSGKGPDTSIARI